MVIVRAIFWVGLVALLMPKGPDLGLGDPGPTELSAKVATGLSLLDSFHDRALRDLAAVKADIAANRKPGWIL